MLGTRVGIDLHKEETWEDFKNALLAGITITKHETDSLRSLVDLVKDLSKDASENPQVCSHVQKKPVEIDTNTLFLKLHSRFWNNVKRAQCNESEHT